MKLTVTDSKVRIDFGNDVISVEGDELRTTAIEFRREDFRDMCSEYHRQWPKFSF